MQSCLPHTEVQWLTFIELVNIILIILMILKEEENLYIYIYIISLSHEHSSVGRTMYYYMQGSEFEPRTPHLFTL